MHKKDTIIVPNSPNKKMRTIRKLTRIQHNTAWHFFPSLLFIPAGLLLLFYRSLNGAGTAQKIILFIALVCTAAGMVLTFFSFPRSLPSSRVTRKRLLILASFLNEFISYAAIAWLALPVEFRAGNTLHLAILFTALGRVSSQKKFRFLIALPLALILVSVNWLSAYQGAFGSPGIDSFRAVFQADQLEITSYILQFLTYRAVSLALVAYLCFTIFFALNQRDLKHESIFSIVKTRGMGLILLGLYLVHSLQTAGPVKQIISNFTASARAFQEEQRKQRVLAERYARATASNIQSPALAANFKGNIIVVIGESLSRRQMSLYGYHRDTTPGLKKWQPELYVHADTISPHSHTVPSLQRVLSSLPGGDDINFEQHFSRNLVAELKRNGFASYWFSNQNQYGIWDNPIALIGMQAEKYEFIRPSFGETYRAGYYDEQLLPRLDQALADSKTSKAVFLHFYAPHTPYCNVIPESARSVLPVSQGLGKKFFGTYPDLSENLNCYDNAIRYLDGLWEKILVRTEASKEPTVVVFFSDHGEAPMYGTGHNSSAHSAYQVEVPHIWYFNKSAKKIFGEKTRTLASHLETPFSLESIYHSVLDLVSASSEDLIPAQSIFSKNYRSAPRKTIPSDLGEYVAYDSREIVDRKDYLEKSANELKEVRRKDPASWKKVWAHHVDTLGKLQEAKGIFGGVELDIVFHPDQNEFFVYHPPVASHGLSLEEYLEAASDKPNLGFWLDWKNPNESEFSAALERLKTLEKRFRLHGRALVETASDSHFPAMKALAPLFGKHSYYLPTEQIRQCSNGELPQETCSKFAKDYVAIVEEIGANTISFDADGMKFVHLFRKQFGPYQWISWKLDWNTTQPGFAESISTKQLEVMLVSFPSVFSW